MDTYFILQIIKQLWIINKDYCVYFAALNVLVLVTGNHFIWLLHPLDTPLSTVHFVSVLVCFWETPYFLALKDAASSFFISPVNSPKIIHLSKEFCFFIREWTWKSSPESHMYWFLLRCSCFFSFSADITRNICLYFNYWIDIFIYQQISVSISIWSTVCNPMDWSPPGSSVLHCLLELAQTHVHCVSNAIQPSHPLSPPSPLAFNIS